MAAKLLFFLIISTYFLKCMSEKRVELRGSPEVDYPTYYVIPKTSFRCSEQLYNPGFYADIETRCQVFHYCYEHRQESFLCPMGTIFNQPILACDYWYSSDCSLAPSYYKANAIKRNEDVVDEPDDIVESQSGNLFDKMAGLYETRESPVLKNDSAVSENELSKDVGISSEELIEKYNKAEDYDKYSYDTQLNLIDEKQLEIVKYDVEGSNNANIHKGSKNQQPYENDNMEDFIFSEDGMLHRSQEVYQVHPNQEDTYKIHPSDINFDQVYSGYDEIPSKENFNFDPNEDLDYEISDFDLQKRYSDTDGTYVRRPSRRRPIIITPEVEPEIVQLPVTQHKRRPIEVGSTFKPNADSESTYETAFDPNIYNVGNVKIPNEGFEDVASSGEFSQDDQSRNQNLKLNDPNLLYNIPEEIKDENNSELRVFSNIPEDEILNDNFGSGSNGFTILNTEQGALEDSNYGDKLEIFNINAEDTGMQVFPDESSDTIVDYGSRPDSDAFLGFGSKEHIQPHSSERSSFSEGQYIFSDGEDVEISDTETSYAQPISLLDTFEGSGISAQETLDMSNFEDVNDPDQFSPEYSDNNPEYGEDSFSPEAFGKFLPSESSENNEWGELVPVDSGESSDFSYLPYDLQEISNEPQDGYEKTLPEIREIDGTYYIFSDSGHQPSNMYGDSSETYSEKDYGVNENFEIPSGDLIDNVDSQYVPGYSNFKVHDVEKELHNLDYQDLSSALESTHERLMEASEDITSPDVSEEEYTVGDSETTTQFTTEDVTFLEIMSQTPIPMLQNLFEVSEKSSSDAIEDEISNTEIISSEQDIIDQNLEDSTSLIKDKLESLYSDHSPDTDVSEKSSSGAIEDEIPRTEIISPEQGNNDQNHVNPASSEEADEFESYFSNTSDAEVDTKSSSNEIEDEAPHAEFISPEEDIVDKNHENPDSLEEVFDFESFLSILGAQQKLTDDALGTKGSDQDGTEVSLPEENVEAFVPKKEADPFNPLFSEGEEILASSKSDQKLTLKAPPMNKNNATESTVKNKDIKEVARGKRSETLRTFNPQKKGNQFNPLSPSKETFRETMFTNIPSDFLKMKHSSLTPYAYNYGLKNSGLKTRAGDQLESSKLSKLTNFGKRVLEAKSKNFNIMKRYLSSYRNN